SASPPVATWNDQPVQEADSIVIATADILRRERPLWRGTWSIGPLGWPLRRRHYGVMAMAIGRRPVLIGGRAVLVAIRIGVTVPAGNASGVVGAALGPTVLVGGRGVVGALRRGVSSIGPGVGTLAVFPSGVMAMSAVRAPVLIGGRGVLVAIRIGVTVPGETGY